MEILDKIEQLCKKRNISIAKMLSDLNLARGIANNWKKRGTMPNGETIIKIANYFGVSSDYLLGIKPKAETKNDIITDIIIRARTDSDYLNVISNIDKLNKEEFEALKIFVNALNKK
jgi:transcriptional regulator with XRE-family HTH domain